MRRANNNKLKKFLKQEYIVRKDFQIYSPSLINKLILASKLIVKTYIFMPFTDNEYFEVIKKNETVKEAFETIKQECINLQDQTNCPEEDIENFLKFISKHWNN